MDEELPFGDACEALFSTALRSEAAPSSSTAPDHFHSIPPFEAFAYDLSKNRLEIQLKEDVRMGDLIYVRVISVDSVGARVYPLCFASRIRRDLNLTDLKFVVPVSSLERRINVGSYQKVRVTGVNPFQLSFEAGPFDYIDLPEYYRNSAELESKASFQSYLTDNPKPIHDLFLGLEVGLPERSAMSCLVRDVTQRDFIQTAGVMRLEQDSRQANRYVQEAADLIGKSEYDHAIVLANDALKILPKLADGMVTRGAAYYHKKKWDLAVKDFEEALIHDADHRNAKLYLATTCVHWANELLGKEDYEKAKTYYRKALEFKPGDKDAKEGLETIRQKENEVLVVKEVSAEERRREERRRKRTEREEQEKKRAKMKEDRQKLAEIESFIAALKKK